MAIETNSPSNEEEVPLHTFPHTMFQRAEQPPIPGSLHVTEKTVRWTPASEAHQPWIMPFVDINLHATAMEETPKCIYAQVGDEGLEVRFIPEREETLHQIFEVFNHGAERNIDAQQQESGPLLPFGNFASEVLPAECDESRMQDYDAVLDTSALDNTTQNDNEKNGFDQKADDGE